MNWEPFTELSKHQRTELLCPKLRKRLSECVERYRRDFPDKHLNEKALPRLLDLAMQFYTARDTKDEPSRVAAWCRFPIPEQSLDSQQWPEHWPTNKGEQFLYTIGYLGPLCWGWRKDRKGTSSAPGYMQIITEHFQTLDPATMYLCIFDLRGKSIDDAVAEMAKYGHTTRAETLRQKIHRL